MADCRTEFDHIFVSDLIPAGGQRLPPFPPPMRHIESVYLVPVGGEPSLPCGILKAHIWSQSPAKSLRFVSLMARLGTNDLSLFVHIGLLGEFGHSRRRFGTLIESLHNLCMDTFAKIMYGISWYWYDLVCVILFDVFDGSSGELKACRIYRMSASKSIRNIP